MKKHTIRLLALLLALLPLLGVFTQGASAATSRVAVIKELTGTVKVKKAGGSKEFTAFKKMSLNEGDILAVGEGGSAVLQFANGTSEDDLMTASANTTLTFSKLSDSKGTTTKVSMLKGTVWSSVKSIKTKDDEFTLETPTAIMGVRGTNLQISVNPVTGASQFFIASGFGRITPKETEGTTDPNDLILYPSQQITIGQNEDPTDLTNDISIVDVDDLIRNSSPQVIAAYLKSKEAIDKENDEFIKKQQQLLDQFGKPPEELNYDYKNQQDLDRIQRILFDLMANLVKQAGEKGKIGKDDLQKLIDEANKTLTNKIDLVNVKPIELTDKEKKKQEEIAKKQKEEEEKIKKQKELEEQQRKLDELQQKIKELKKKQEEANKAAEEAKKKKAKDEYESKLSEVEKKIFEDESKKREEELKHQQQSPTPPQQSPTPPPVSGGGGSTEVDTSADLSLITIKHWDLENGDAQVQRDISILPNQIAYTLDLEYGISEIEIKPVTIQPNATVKVYLNGILLPNSFEAYDEYTAFFVQDQNEITFVVTSPTGSTTKTYKLNVTRHSLPSWLSFTAENSSNNSPIPVMGMTFNNFMSKVADPISSVTFNIGITDPEYSISDFYCEDCSGVGSTVTGNTVEFNGLVQGFYSFNLELVNQSESTVYYTIYFDNGVPVPNWSSFSEPFHVHKPETGIDNPMDISNNATTGEFHLNIGADVEDLILIPNVNNVLPIYPSAVWNETTGEAMLLGGCGISNDGQAILGACLNNFALGDNTLKVFMTDENKLNGYIYTLHVYRSELPTGVVNWSFNYKTNDIAQSASWSYVPKGEFSGENPKYFVKLPSNIDAGTAELSVSLDRDQISYYKGDSIPVSSGSPDFEGETSGSEVINEPITLSQGTNHYYLSLQDSSTNNSSTIELIIVKGDPDLPNLAIHDALDEYENTLPIMFTGNDNIAITTTTPISSLTLYLDNDSRDVGQAQYNGQTINYSQSFIINNLAADSINTILITLWDETHSVMKTHTLSVFNNVDISGFQLSDITSEDDITWYGEQLSPFNWRGSVSDKSKITITPKFSEGTSLAGVYNSQGVLMSPISGDSYDIPLIPNGTTSLYVAVRKDNHLIATEVLIDETDGMA